MYQNPKTAHRCIRGKKNQCDCCPLGCINKEIKQPNRGITFQILSQGKGCNTEVKSGGAGAGQEVARRPPAGQVWVQRVCEAQHRGPRAPRGAAELETLTIHKTLSRPLSPRVRRAALRGGSGGRTSVGPGQKRPRVGARCREERDSNARRSTWALCSQKRRRGTC